MLKALKKIVSLVYFSLPVQLLILQVRHHKLILLEWLVLYAAVLQLFGTRMGIPLLFLEPEYMGSVNFLSLLMVGCGVGAFIAAYNVATYIQDAYQFHFLAVEKHSFLIYFMNNSLLPLGFVSLFTVKFLQFQSYLHDGFEAAALVKLLGFYAGLFAVTAFIFFYFFSTNKSIFDLLGEKIVKEELQTRRVIIGKARAGLLLRHRVDLYFRLPWKLVNPDETIPADFRGTVKMLNQHHGNALLLQLLFFISIVILGLLEKQHIVIFPAAVSMLLFFSMVLMLTSAFTFWFRKLGPLLLVVLAVVYVVLDRNEVFSHRHQALGMNYEAAPAPYTADRIFEFARMDSMQQDLDSTYLILERWKAQWQQKYGREKLPRMVILCTSGGGQRAAYFTVRCMQQLDSLTGGAFFDHTRLIAGASGGMVGAAYYRELKLLKLQGKEVPGPRAIAANISRDLLNRITFKMVTGLVYPTGKVTIAGGTYPADRGWSFDDQLITNLGAFADRRVSDYESWERSAALPMLVLSPVIMEDGRRLYISPVGVSYLCRTLLENGSMGRGVTGIEFGRFFKGQEADSLLYATALRMNASFPLITPYIQLPSEPPLRVIDAGIADNLGIQTASRFLYLFHDWIAKNTDGVILLQVRDSETRSTRVPVIHRKGLLSGMVDPIGATYSSFGLSKDLAAEDYLSMAESVLPGKFQYLTLEYSRQDSSGFKASLSWHLTLKEREDLEAALSKPQNLETFGKMEKWLKP